ncbi:MAG TPA: hypothetical protein VI318_06620 [Baekduia sp.]
MLAAGLADLLDGRGEEPNVSTPSPRASAVRAAAAAASSCWNTAGSCAPSAPERNWSAMLTPLTVATALIR